MTIQLLDERKISQKVNIDAWLHYEASLDSVYLEVAEDNGFIRFRLQKADTISMLDVDSLVMKIHDKSTNFCKMIKEDVKFCHKIIKNSN